MDVTSFMRLLLRNWKWLLFVPLVAAAVVYYIEWRAPKEYDSSLEIYTGFASGYNIMSTDTKKFDYYEINNALDNLINTIKSENVLKSVSMKLLAQSLIYGAKGDSHYITHDSYVKLRELVPSNVMALVDPHSVDTTAARFERYMRSNNSNFLYKLVNLYHPNFSLWALEKIEVKKVGQSDLLQVSYRGSDPALCYQTLVILSSEFLDDYRSFYESQTLDVVKYFERQLAITAAKLRDAEDRYMVYNKEHRVINYYEQTKAIAGQLQAFELDYDKILTSNAGARQAVGLLESKMGLNAALRLKSQQVLQARNKIAKQTAQLTTANVFSDDSNYVRFNDRVFNQSVAMGRNQLRGVIDTMAVYRNSPEGIEIEQVLNDWLDQAVLLDASTAALRVMDQRRVLINNMFDYYAPVGANVKRQEREIDVIEREYLSLLHSLSLAKLKEQQISMSGTSLKVSSAPTFPINAEPSKRKLMTIMAFVVVFLLVLVVLIFIELTDRTIRDVVRVKRFTGLSVAGVYPLVVAALRKKCVDNIEELSQTHLISQVLRLRKDGDLPLTVTLVSMQGGEGKSFVAGVMQDGFQKMGYSVYNLDPDQNYNSMSKEYAQALEPWEFTAEVVASHDVYITQLPALDAGATPMELLLHSKLLLLVCRANRAWTKTDHTMLEVLRERLGDKVQIYVMLNGVDGDAMELFLGEKPKKSNSLRRLMKRIFTSQYTSHRKLL